MEPTLSGPGIDFATVGERFDGIRSIAVLRGGGLGDLLFAVPALASLHAAYPDAEITLLGMPLHAELLGGRFGAVARVEELPTSPGVRDEGEGPESVEAFVERLRGRFDLGIQVHGGGRNSNPFIARLETPHTVGTKTEDAVELERTVPYVYYQNEVLRSLEVAALAGAGPTMLEPRLTATDDDRAIGRDAVGYSGRPLLVVHPGATDPRRRWGSENFADVAARFVRGGGRVLVIGGPAEREAALEIAERARAAVGGEHVAVRPGDLSMAELVGILTQADVFLGNDSGPRHLAQALGTRTASVYWFGNFINAGPLERGRHRAQLSWTTHCPVCGRDATQVGWTAERCEHDVSFVDDVQPDAVWSDVASLTATIPPPHGR